MKAIPTAEKPCLACHGKTLAPQVAARLKELYPDDRATGYAAGEIRGAITLSRPLQ
jgi:excinuclease UvrABC helicase subunit UvrB